MTAIYLKSTKALYEQDYQLWLDTTIKQLRTKEFEQVDWDNLLEELESLSGSNRREMQNRLRILLMHLLKHQYQPEYRSSSWVSTIIEQYRQIEVLLLANPSLKSYYLNIFFDCYSKAIRDASAETNLPIKTFPLESPFLPEDVINADFIFSIVHQQKG